MYILKSREGSGYLTMIQDKGKPNPCYVFLNDITQAKPFTKKEAEEIAPKARCIVVSYNGPVRQEPVMPVPEKKEKKIKPITVTRRAKRNVHPPKIRV